MVLRHVLTLILVIIGWIFFRAVTLSDAVEYLRTMFGGGTLVFDQAAYYLKQYAPEFILCLIGIFPLKRTLRKFFDAHADSPALYTLGEVLPVVFAFFVFGLAYMELVSGGFNPFIYFQF